MSRVWQRCRVCGNRHVNPASSSICSNCGKKERLARLQAEELEEAALSQPQAGEPVANIVPEGCTGKALAFDPGVLHVNKDGSGYIAVDEDVWELEDDRCEGPDGPQGSVHWITRLPASEMQALRDFLNGNSAASPQPALAVKTREVTDRKTFVVPDGYEAVRDEDGRATGEVRLIASPPPSGEVEAARLGWDIGRNSSCPAGVLADTERTERDWLKALEQLRPALSIAPATADGWRTKAVDDVLAERKRQVEVEGWTPEHDDAYTRDELADAAACYAAPESVYWGPTRDRAALRWPWQVNWWKPDGKRRNLVKAGALILAEIERLDRLPAVPTATGGR